LKKNNLKEVLKEGKNVFGPFMKILIQLWWKLWDLLDLIL